MKFVISQKKISESGNMSLFGFLLWILPLSVLILSFVMPVRIGGQTVRSKSKQTNKQLPVNFRLSEKQLDRVRPIIQKQVVYLQKIFTRYSEKIDINYLSFWTDPDVWLELKDNRKNFAADLSRILTKEQARVLQFASFELENKNLFLLLDEQMLILIEELDLEVQQDTNIYKILSRDIKKKRRLINNPSSSDDCLIRELKVISDETENKIKKILFPEQNRTYQKHKRNSLQNGVKLWGMVPFNGNLPRTGD